MAGAIAPDAPADLTQCGVLASEWLKKTVDLLATEHGGGQCGTRVASILRAAAHSLMWAQFFYAEARTEPNKSEQRIGVKLADTLYDSHQRALVRAREECQVDAKARATQREGSGSGELARALGVTTKTNVTGIKGEGTPSTVDMQETGQRASDPAAVDVPRGE